MKESRSGEEWARWRTYPEYEDSGVHWLGKIPTHWTVAPLYARFEVALGKMLDAKRISGDHLGPYLRNIDVQWDKVNIDNLPTMDFHPTERDRYLLQEGDLLVCEGGEVGRTAVWRAELPECFYQKAIHRVRPLGDANEPRFLFYIMYAASKLGVFTAGGNPNTIDHLTAVQLRHYRFAFPSVAEQRAIAAFLDRETAKIDALIAKKERLIELLHIRDLKRAVLPVPKKSEQREIGVFLNAETRRMDGLIRKVRRGIDRLKEYRTALISAAVTGKIDVREEAA